MAPHALEDVTKHYGDVVALAEVSLEVGTPGLHCLLGPNGSGKTTILRLLAGLERPTAGTVRRDGPAPGCGFQEPTFYPSLSVRENLDVFGRLRGDEPSEAWREALLERLALDPVLDRPAGGISGGYARKLDLALAFLGRPSVVLLDEPLAALDDVSRDRFRDFLTSYCEAGNAVVVSTHRITAFEPVLDRLTIVHDGDVLEDNRREALDVDADGRPLRTRYVDIVRATERASGATGHVDSPDAPTDGSPVGDPND